MAAALSLPPTLHTNAMCDHHNLGGEVDDDDDGDVDDDGDCDNDDHFGGSNDFLIKLAIFLVGCGGGGSGVFYFNSMEKLK